jgi:hypothetical protein
MKGLPLVFFRTVQAVLLLAGLGCLGYGGYRLQDEVRFLASSVPVEGTVVAVRERREERDKFATNTAHAQGRTKTTVQIPVVRYRSPVDGRLHRTVSRFSYDGDAFQVDASIPTRASSRDPEDGRHSDPASRFGWPLLILVLGLLGTVLPVLVWRIDDHPAGGRGGWSLRKAAVALGAVGALVAGVRWAAPWLGARELLLLLAGTDARVQVMRSRAPAPGELLGASERGVTRLPFVGAGAATCAVRSAIEDGRREDLRRYLAAYRDPKVGFPLEVERALYFTAAVRADDAAALRLLADAGLDPRRDPYALEEAVTRGRPAMLRALAALGAAPVDADARQKLVFSALLGNDDDTLLALVELGWFDPAPLYRARAFGGPEAGTLLDLALVRALPRTARELERRGLVPASPLLARLVARDLEGMRAVLPEDEWTKAQIFGAPLLSFAALCGDEALVRRLLARGADPAAVATIDPSSPDLTALDEATERGHLGVARALTALPGAKAWLDPQDRTPPVCRAAVKGRWDLVRVLVDAGASPSARCTGIDSGDRNATPLHRAAADGALETVEYLLARGADPLAEGDERLLPVELARDDAVRAALEKAGGRGP